MKKKLLVVGGTGSFGYAMIELCIKKKLFSEIRVFSRDEKKQDDMRKAINNKNVKFYLGDVRDFDSIDFAINGVDYIFNAAALKQVPSCEFYPYEAFKTNVIGAKNLVNAAIKHKVKKVVSLSTDKAVYPINAMGVSKAMMEKIMVSQSLQKNSLTIFCVTRYGNVMGSRGSIIPLLFHQINTKKPLTITDGGMTRFMMSMDEALDLVLYALKNGKNGEIFIKKTEAAKLSTLEKAIKLIKNKKNYRTKIIGIRHGEKMHETLMSSEEKNKSIEKKGFFIIKPDVRELNYSKFYNKGDSKRTPNSDYTSSNTKHLSVEELVKKIRKSKI